jgi:hypothetical protein
MIDYNFELRKKSKPDEPLKYELPQNEASVLDVYRYYLEFQNKLNSNKRKYGGKNEK